jgi:hypothetical protein
MVAAAAAGITMMVEGKRIKKFEGKPIEKSEGEV